MGATLAAERPEPGEGPCRPAGAAGAKKPLPHLEPPAIHLPALPEGEPPDEGGKAAVEADGSGQAEDPNDGVDWRGEEEGGKAFGGGGPGSLTKPEVRGVPGIYSRMGVQLSCFPPPMPSPTPPWFCPRLKGPRAALLGGSQRPCVWREPRQPRKQGWPARWGGRRKAPSVIQDRLGTFWPERYWLIFRKLNQRSRKGPGQFLGAPAAPQGFPWSGTGGGGTDGHLPHAHTADA